VHENLNKEKHKIASYILTEKHWGILVWESTDENHPA